MSVVLKPHDVVVLLKLITSGESRSTYKELAESLGMSPSEVHAAVQRAARAGLLDWARRVPNRKALQDFLLHGIRYVFVPDRGRTTRGMPTAGAAPPLAKLLGPTNEAPPVWPDPEGEVRGEEFEPLHRSAPRAARNDAALYELLAIVDALRSGGARVRQVATRELERRLGT